MSTEKVLSNLNLDNIAEELSETELDSIASDIIEGFNTDKDSRSDWEDKYEDYLKLALQVQEYKSYPWPDASNIKFTLLSISAIQFNSRMYPALVPRLSFFQ